MRPCVIAVLSGGVDAHGALSPLSRSRMAAGVRLYRSIPHAKLVFSGNLPMTFRGAALPEAWQMEGFALRAGVPLRDIVLEPRSISTLENACFMRPIVDGLDPGRFIVVTSDYHLERTRYVFRKVFRRQIEFVAVPFPFSERDRRTTLRKELIFFRHTRRLLWFAHPSVAVSLWIAVGLQGILQRLFRGSVERLIRSAGDSFHAHGPQDPRVPVR